MSLYLVRHGRPVVERSVPVAELTGAEPDLDRCRGLSMADLIVCEQFDIA